MKKIIIILALMFFNHVAIAGTIYTYTDKDGNTVISNTPMPENYEKKAKRIESYERDSPAAIAAYQIKQRAAEARGFREWQNSQSNSTPTKSAQTSNYVESQKKRQGKIDNTDKLRKEYWDEVERCRRNKCKVSQNLSDEYHKAVEEDPRTITTITTTKRSRR
jgi:uncharacterized protein YxeA